MYFGFWFLFLFFILYNSLEYEYYYIYKTAKFLGSILQYLTFTLNNLQSIVETKKMNVVNYSYDDVGRFQEYLITNNSLLGIKEALENIYSILSITKSFTNFGYTKVIMIHAVLEDNKEYSLHHNILITNNTTFDQYYKKIENILVSRYDEGYDIDVIPVFRVKVWNMDNMI